MSEASAMADAEKSEDEPMQPAAKEKKFPVWKAIRRRFPPTHPFFASGNLERELLAKQVSLQITDDEKEYLGRTEEAQFWDVNCPIVGCGARLKGLEALETHYSVRHIAACSFCKRVFPTGRLLDLHISESHDAFFKAKVARNYPMYECLVEGCDGRFQSDLARHQHLLDKHKFPRSFQFHKKKHLSQRQRQRLREKQHIKPVHGTTSGGANKLESEKIKDKSTHIDDVLPRPESKEGDGSLEMEVDIDVLASRVSKLSTADSKVPPVVSFGRRRGRGLAFVPVISRQQSGSHRHK